VAEGASPRGYIKFSSIWPTACTPLTCMRSLYSPAFKSHVDLRAIHYFTFSHQKAHGFGAPAFPLLRLLALLFLFLLDPLGLFLPALDLLVLAFPAFLDGPDLSSGSSPSKGRRPWLEGSGRLLKAPATSRFFMSSLALRRATAKRSKHLLMPRLRAPSLNERMECHIRERSITPLKWAPLQPLHRTPPKLGKP